MKPVSMINFTSLKRKLVWGAKCVYEVSHSTSKKEIGLS